MLTAQSDQSKSIRARIVSGSVVLLSGSTLAMVLNLAYNVAIARCLGPDGFGHATVVYTLLTLISAATLSFQIIAAKVVAQQSTEGEKSAAYRALHRGSWICGFVVAALLTVCRGPITSYLNLPSPVLVDLLAVGSAFYIPLGTRRGYAQGALGFRRFAGNLVLEGAVRLVGSLIAVLLGAGVTGVIAANAAAMAISWVALAPKLAAPVPSPIRLSTAFREFSQAIIFFAGQVLINNYSIVLVKHYFPATEAGLYAAIAMVGRVVFTLSSAVVYTMFPLVAGTSPEERKKLNVLATSLMLVLGIGSVLALALRVMPARVWTLFFGAQFAVSGPYSLSYLFAFFAFTTVIYSLSVVVISYEMSYKIANTSWVQLVFSGVLIAAVCRFHSSLHQVILVQFVLMVVLLLLVGAPFLRDSLRHADPLSESSLRPVRLLRRITEDEVISEFLRSDFENSAYREYHHSMRSIVYTPNLDDAPECAKRRALLFLRHLSLWKELPSDTEWYEVEVKLEDLDRIQVFPRAQWRKIAEGNFVITEVAGRMRQQQNISGDPFLDKIASIRGRLDQHDPIPGSVLLIGVNESEPLTIIDGNHRFVAGVLQGRVEKLRFLCGLSPKMTQCCWYRTNLLTLARYGRNLLRQVTQRPDVELARLFENPG
ncbi:MAG TPA: oligosaccharide flippase family protein [Acidobacteriaceae bacterium]